jgi:predicted dehydrogenase
VRVLVVGLGAAGTRHVENARALGHAVAACTARADATIETFADLDAAAGWEPDAVVVASETSLHAPAASWAVAHRLPVLVEKPLARTAAEARGVVAAADAAGVRVRVGYNLRFHPAVAAIRAALPQIGDLLTLRAEVGAHLPDWHPGEDYARSYAARADQGGGALLTLSHELDYVLWLAGPVREVRGIATRVSALEVDVDDSAEVVCLHEGRILSSVHADFVDRSYNRRCRIVGSNGTLEWSWGEGVVLLRDGAAAASLWRDERYDLAESYRDELRDFLAGGGRCATGLDGLRVLEVCDAVERFA